MNICVLKCLRDTLIHIQIRDKVATAPSRPNVLFISLTLLENPQFLPDELGDIIPPACPRSALRSVSHAWNSSKVRHPWEPLPGVWTTSTGRSQCKGELREVTWRQIFMRLVSSHCLQSHAPWYLKSNLQVEFFPKFILSLSWKWPCEKLLQDFICFTRHGAKIRGKKVAVLSNALFSSSCHIAKGSQCPALCLSSTCSSRWYWVWVVVI